MNHLHQRLLSALFLVFVVLFTLVGGGVGPAEAADIGWRVKFPDAVVVHHGISHALLPDAIEAATNDLDDNTDLTAHHFGTVVVNGSVAVFYETISECKDSALGTAIPYRRTEQGLVRCLFDWDPRCNTSDKRSEAARIQLNMCHPFILQRPTRYKNFRRLVTHELGHVAGLGHEDNCSISTVMKTNENCSSNREFRPYDINILNDWY